MIETAHEKDPATTKMCDFVKAITKYVGNLTKLICYRPAYYIQKYISKYCFSGFNSGKYKESDGPSKGHKKIDSAIHSVADRIIYGKKSKTYDGLGPHINMNEVRVPNASMRHIVLSVFWLDTS